MIRLLKYVHIGNIIPALGYMAGFVDPTVEIMRAALDRQVCVIAFSEAKLMIH